MLALNYLSWAFIASVWAFFMALFHRYDAVIVHETSPVTQGFPALVVKSIRRIPMYFWVLDLWPESLQSAGHINNRDIIGFFTWVTKLMYRNSDKILISSKGFRKSILEKGDFADRLEYFPNWAEDAFSDTKTFPIPQLPQGFKVMFAGNIGEAQDFDHIMDAALNLKERKDIKFIIVGDGRRKSFVDNFIKEHDLEETVFAPGRFPIEAMPTFFKEADVMLVSLRGDYIFSLTAPAKLQAYMAAGKPVVAMIDGEARNLIAESRCGLSGPAEDSRTLADNILKMKNMPVEELAGMGKSGLEYFQQNFRNDICIDHLCRILERE